MNLQPTLKSSLKRICTAGRFALAACGLALLISGCSARAPSEEQTQSTTEALDSMCPQMTSTFDGYPAFQGPNDGCSYYDNVCSPDGYNTYQACGGYYSEYGYGYQCVELVYRYFHFRWGVDLPGVGYASQMCNLNLSGTGASYTSSPNPGDLMVWSAGSCGTAGDGHVAVVNGLEGDGTIDVVEENWGSGGARSHISRSCAACFIHAGGGGGGLHCPTGGGWQGPGRYCGSDGISGGADPNTLYYCSAPGGTPSVVQGCPAGCVIAPPGQDDYCASGPSCPTGGSWSGAGWYCWDDGISGGSPNVNYHCPAPGAAPDQSVLCSCACIHAGAGQDDYCISGC